MPYGAPPVVAGTVSERRGGQPLRVIYVGRLEQLKGISYLFEALDRLGRGYELTLVGARPLDPCPPLDQALQHHRWIKPVPHSEVLELIRQHDVLVFPSLCDGFGLVSSRRWRRACP